HTRFSRDWSSDVCSSDLKSGYVAYYDYVKKTWQDTGDLYLDEDGSPKWPGYRTDLRNVSTGKKAVYNLFPTTSGLALGSKPDGRSEERRVGKECRWWMSL